MTSAEGTAPALATNSLRAVAQRLVDHIVWLLLALFALGAGILDPFFLSLANLQNILVQATTLGTLALGVSTCLLVAGIDLSIIGVLVFASTIGAKAVNAGLPGGLGILLVIVIGAAVGWVNGLGVAKLRMNPLIETLAMGLFLGGAVLAMTRGQTITIHAEAYTWIGNTTIGGWPVMPVVLVLLYAAAFVVLGRTTWGRRLYTVGGNPHAARAAGVDVERTKLQAFVVSGTLSGIAGVLATAYLSGVNTTVGSELLLYAVAAPVIGGVSLFGGRGRVSGMLGGVLLITVVQVGLQIIDISAYFVQMVGGGMILLAVLVDALRVGLREEVRP